MEARHWKAILLWIAVLGILLQPSRTLAQGILPGILGGSAPAAGGATWTLIQHPNASCSSATTCTVAMTQATGTGNLLVIMGLTSSHTGTFDMTAISAGGTYVDDSGAGCAVGTAALGSNCGHVLSSTSGVSSIVVTYANGNAGAGNTWLEIIEYHRSTGTATFDAAGNVSNAGSGSPADPGVALTLSGTSDVIVQSTVPVFTLVTAISGSYTNPTDLPLSGSYGFAGALNMSSGAAPNWTISNTASPTVGSGIAFK